MRSQVLPPGCTSRCWLRLFWLAFQRLDIELVKHKASLYCLSRLASDRLTSLQESFNLAERSHHERVQRLRALFHSPA